jgi:ABC-type lipoprotein export system ATPase subunit
VQPNDAPDERHEQTVRASRRLDLERAETWVARGEGVVRHFPTATEDVVAIDGVDIEVTGGELTVIAGPSGSGKSTLLHLLAAFDLPDDGIVTIAGAATRALSARERRAVRRTRVGYVLPQPSDNLIDRLDVAANIRLASKLRGVPIDVEGVLAPIGLTGFGGRRPPSLSGGEQQRLAFAIAAIGRPEVVFADEPTSALDRANVDLLVSVMRTITTTGAAVVVASHDQAVIDAADHVVRLDHGRRVA